MAIKASSLATSTTTTSTPTAASSSLHRTLGTIGMLASPFLFFSLAANGFADGDSNRIGAALGLVFVVGWFAIVYGFWELRAAGTRFSRLPLMLEIVGVLLAGAFQVYEFAAPGSDSLLYTITDISWPLSMLLLLVTGIVIIFQNRFEGWLRFTPLAAALWLPFGVVLMNTVGLTAGQAIGGLHTAAGWFLMAYAVRRAGRLSR